MRIMIACIHYPVASGRYVADAFRNLGHEVKTIGYTTDNQIWGITVDNKYTWTPDSLIKDASPTWPDLVIVMDSIEQIWSEVANVGFHCPVAVYGVDNHVRNYDNKLFQHQFLAHYHGGVYPVDPNRADMTWIPCATSQIAFPPSKIAWSDREFDVCCIGVQYPRRAKLVQMLKDAGLKVFAATGLVYDEYRDAYQNSRISLCVSVAGDVAQRFFETAGMGCLVLSDHLADLDDFDTNRPLGFAGAAFYETDAHCVQLAFEFINGDVEKLQAQQGAAAWQKIVLEKHTWDARAQVVVDWFNKEYYTDGGRVYNRMDQARQQELTRLAASGLGLKEYGVKETVEPIGVVTSDNTMVVHIKPVDHKPYLNLGCGKTHLPSKPPAGHELVDPAVYSYPLWENVDKVEGVGADKTFDLFTYPWPLESDSYDGALCAHIVEHIPHEIITRQNYSYGETNPFSSDMNYMGRAKELQQLQDGWYAFLSELYRVLTPGALVHIVSPYGWSDGAIVDPSHTRYLTINTFTHSMTPDISDGSTFKYNNGGINFKIHGQPQYRFTPLFAHLIPQASDPQEEVERKERELQFAIQTRLNTVYDFYIVLECIK